MISRKTIIYQLWLYLSNVVIIQKAEEEKIAAEAAKVAAETAKAAVSAEVGTVSELSVESPSSDKVPVLEVVQPAPQEKRAVMDATSKLQVDEVRDG